ncbi:MAG TPA: hypothetical protein DCX54_02245, partial [Flavobacteriales bacterium]|nr:hypothetical protein [Flavobacteriales bacterium]
MKNLYSFSLILLLLSILQSFEGAAQVNIVNGSTTDCQDSLYDSGGQTGSYANSENLEYTISPTGASTITITVDSINIGAGDVLRIHDGPTSASTVLYEFTDTSVFIPAPITSSGGDITVHFVSDGSTVDFGFKLHWAANTAPASVSVSGISTFCIGSNIVFTAN